MQQSEIRGGVRGPSRIALRFIRATRLLRNDNSFRFQRRLKGFSNRFAQGTNSLADFEAGLHSWLGHARQADTQGLRRAILGGRVFRWGAGQGAATG